MRFAQGDVVNMITASLDDVLDILVEIMIDSIEEEQENEENE